MGGRVRQALESAGGLTIQDIAPDGRWLVTRDDIESTMRVKAAGAKTEVDLSWLEYTQPVRFTHDGSALLFTEQGARSGINYATCIRRTDGSPMVRLGDGFGVDLSPDGKWAMSIVSSPPRLMLYPTGAGQPQRVDIGPLESLNGAVWLPDGRRILLCGAEPGHASRCYLHDGEGPPRAVTGENVAEPVAAPDGRHFLAQHGGTFARMHQEAGEPAALYSIDGGDPRPVPGLPPDDVPVRFAPDGRSVIVAQNTAPARVERVLLDTGRRELLYTIAPPRTAGIIEVGNVTVADDPAEYAYSFLQMLSRLFVVQGVR
jgi:dipeptidyl aminopeptidase/acylaminoacyl peptidase